VRWGEKKRKYSLLEQFIDGDWTKWSNNFNYLNKKCSKLEKELTQALTHFSFNHSDGAFMLRDL
jgi:spore maturation protein CgeB